MYEDRKEYGGKTMRIEQVPAYELVLTQDIPDIHSKGYLLKHKKSGARVMLLENDDDNKYLISLSAPRLPTVLVWRIFWNTVYCAVPKNTR